MSILVAADFDADAWSTWWPLLQAALPNERLLRRPEEAAREDIDVALVANPPAGSLRGLPRLRLIQSLWAGVDRLLADPGVPVEVPLARMVDPAMNTTMAQTALWAVLSLQRGMFDYAAQQRAGVWRQHDLRRADEMTIAVLGLGEMGRTSARLLASHGYRVLGWSRSGVAALAGVALHAGASALPQVLAQAEVVVNLLPLTPQTRGLFGAATFARLPRGASLVNLARGAHVVEADLLAALDAGQLRHAVLDVFATEPLPPESPFWSMDNVILTPHASAASDAHALMRHVETEMARFESGEALRYLVDRTIGY